MAALGNWKVPVAAQPKSEDYSYDLDGALSAVVGLRVIIPPDAYTAETLGTERAGNGVLIENNLVLTIGYLVMEAQSLWLHLSDGRAVEGHVLGYDQESGFSLVQVLGRVEKPALKLGRSRMVELAERVVVAGAGGSQHSVAARVIAKQEFAGYWEYVLDEALFTAPAHPNWGGAAVIGVSGELIGIGSLQLEGARERGGAEPLNMAVPIDLLPPVLDDLLKYGRRNTPARPWLGIYATEMEDKVVIMGVANKGPAECADLRSGDIILGIVGEAVHDLAGFYRRLWSLGEAGIDVLLTLYRDGRTFDVRVTSSDRLRFLKTPRLH